MNVDAPDQTGSEDEKLKGSPLYGGVIAFLSSLCCTVPLIAVILGFAGVPFLLRLSKFRPYFIVLSLILMGGALWWTWRRNRSCCVTREQQKRLNRTLTIMAGAYLIVFLGLSYGLGALVNQYDAPSATVGRKQSLSEGAIGNATRRLDVKVADLDCAACSTTIPAFLIRQPGIEDAKVNYPEGTGYVLFDDSITKEQVVAKFADAGYKVEITGESRLAN